MIDSVSESGRHGELAFWGLFHWRDLWRIDEGFVTGVDSLSPLAMLGACMP